MPKAVPRDIHTGKSGTVPSNQGREKKEFEGHYYTLDKKLKSTYWRCDRWSLDKCTGRLIEYTDGSIKLSSAHNHGANYGKGEALKFVHNAKIQANQNVSKKILMLLGINTE